MNRLGIGLRFLKQKIYLILFIGNDEPLSAKTQVWIKAAHAYEKEEKLG